MGETCKKRFFYEPGKTYGLIKILRRSERPYCAWVCKCEKCGYEFTGTASQITPYKDTGCVKCRTAAIEEQNKKVCASSLGRNIAVLVNATDEEISMLSECQQKVSNLLREGYKACEISKMLGKTPSYAKGIIAQAVKSIARIRSGDISNYIRRQKRVCTSSLELNAAVLVNATDEEISMLSECQQKVSNLLREGYKACEISKMLGKTPSYAKGIIAQAVKSIARIRSGDISNYIRRQKRRRDSHFINYSEYIDRDLSILSRTEKAVVELKFSNPDFSNLEIANILGLSRSTCSILLSRALKKLDGNYEEDKEYHREYNKKYNEIYRKEQLEKIVSVHKERIHINLTQKQFSDLFGIPVDIVKSWRPGRGSPPEWVQELVVEKLNGSKKTTSQ